MKKIKRLYKILYLKWIKGECRHFCHHCKFGENCDYFFED